MTAAVDTWWQHCAMPEEFHKLPEAEQEIVIKAIESAAEFEKVEPSVVATRPCGWHWHPLDREKDAV